MALAGQREELRAVLARQHAQEDARAGRRLGRGDVRRADGIARPAAEHGPLHFQNESAPPT
jgi:hypothetical protein